MLQVPIFKTNHATILRKIAEKYSDQVKQTPGEDTPEEPYVYICVPETTVTKKTVVDGVLYAGGGVCRVLQREKGADDTWSAWPENTRTSKKLLEQDLEPGTLLKIYAFNYLEQDFVYNSEQPFATILMIAMDKFGDFFVAGSISTSSKVRHGKVFDDVIDALDQGLVAVWDENTLTFPTDEEATTYVSNFTRPVFAGEIVTLCEGDLNDGQPFILNTQSHTLSGVTYADIAQGEIGDVLLTNGQHISARAVYTRFTASYPVEVVWDQDYTEWRILTHGPAIMLHAKVYDASIDSISEGLVAIWDNDTASYPTDEDDMTLVSNFTRPVFEDEIVTLQEGDQGEVPFIINTQMHVLSGEAYGNIAKDALGDILLDNGQHISAVARYKAYSSSDKVSVAWDQDARKWIIIAPDDLKIYSEDGSGITITQPSGAETRVKVEANLEEDTGIEITDGTGTAKKIKVLLVEDGPGISVTDDGTSYYVGVDINQDAGISITNDGTALYIAADLEEGTGIKLEAGTGNAIKISTKTLQVNPPTGSGLTIDYGSPYDPILITTNFTPPSDDAVIFTPSGSDDSVQIDIDIGILLDRLNTEDLDDGVLVREGGVWKVIEMSSECQEEPEGNNNAELKNNWFGTGAPGVSDDLLAGYYPGSAWYDTTTNDVYLCIDNTPGAAVWELLN